MLSPRRNRLGFVFYEAKIAGLYTRGAFYDFGGTAERERERERAAISGGVSKRRNDKVATRMVLFVSTFRRGHAVFTVLGVYDALNYPVCNKTRGGTRMTPR